MCSFIGGLKEKIQQLATGDTAFTTLVIDRSVCFISCLLYILSPQQDAIRAGM